MVAIAYQLYSATVFLIASRYQFLQSKLIEINLKVLDEVGLSCIIAVAVDYFVLEVVFIMF